MISHSTDNWSVCVGRPGGVELRVHILWPLTALGFLLAIRADFAQPLLSPWALTIFFCSVTLHELVRVMTATRVGGHTSAVVLGPIGGLTKLHLPVDPPAHLVTALAGPMTYLVLLVAAACGLALNEMADSGDRGTWLMLLNPCAPGIVEPGGVSSTTVPEFVAQLTVWVNWCLLLVSFLPIDPCGGAALLRGVLWPIVGRSTASSVTSRIALGSALAAAVLAVWLYEADSQMARVPMWFPLATTSIFLLYGGCRQINSRRYDVGLAIDEFDSDDEEWLISEWDDEDREAVLVEHMHDKQQEAIDRKRREREANEDEQVDAILSRLRNLRFDQLSEEDRATLKRASRRYRERREDQNSED
ncbi:MAG: hypothetical protein AAGD11_14500 [Planctomycetota bacterium]